MGNWLRGNEEMGDMMGIWREFYMFDGNGKKRWLRDRDWVGMTIRMQKEMGEGMGMGIG